MSASSAPIRPNRLSGKGRLMGAVSGVNVDDMKGYQPALPEEKYLVWFRHPALTVVIVRTLYMPQNPRIIQWVKVIQKWAATRQASDLRRLENRLKYDSLGRFASEMPQPCKKPLVFGRRPDQKQRSSQVHCSQGRGAPKWGGGLWFRANKQLKSCLLSKLFCGHTAQVGKVTYGSFVGMVTTSSWPCGSTAFHNP